MPPTRFPNRLVLVLPGPADDHERWPPAVADQVAVSLAESLALYGVQVVKHMRGAPALGMPRADVALWWPGAGGDLPAPEFREVPARVHVAMSFTTPSERGALARYDAVWVPHERLVAEVRGDLGHRGIPPTIFHRPLPARMTTKRDSEQAARHVSTTPVILVDLRHDFESSVERVIFQLALVRSRATFVLLVPHRREARARARELCDRHALDAFLTSGEEGLAASMPALDLLVGRPTFGEMTLAAAHRVALLWLDAPSGDSHPWARMLREEGVMPDVPGVLQLGSALEARLADPGGIQAQGEWLGECVTGDPRPFLEVLATLESRPHAPVGAAAWERVGPGAALRGEASAQRSQGAQSTQRALVDARDDARAPAHRAAQIEADLANLKARLRSESGETS